MPDPSSSPAATRYEIVLRAETNWLSVDLNSLWRYRDLLTLLVWRDFVARYKQTILGPLWFVLQPLLMTLVFTVIFARVAGLSTDGVPPILFYLCGQLAWNYFAQTFFTNSSTLVTNASLFGKVYFPRLIVPLATLVSNLLAFALQLTTFFAFYVLFRFSAQSSAYGVTASAIWLPAIILQLAAFSLGTSLIMAALTAKYRDLIHITTLIVQVWMYLTPVIYPLSQFPERWRWIAAINPMTAMVESFRLMLIGVGTVEPAHVIWSIACTATVLAIGVIAFSRIEKTFADIA
jgi:lipopolysaccharide transport system permease protein